MTVVRPATRFDENAAVGAWRAALDIRGRPPGAARITRVRTKLRASDALALVADDDGAVTGMLLAELARNDDGAGAVLPGVLHLSMLFVHPDHWRRGVGRALLAALITRYPAVQVWTAADNVEALAAYDDAGFVRTGRSQQLSSGQVIQLEHR